MTNSPNFFSTLNILRFIAVAGTLLVSFIKIFSVNELQPNQEHGFYALAFIAVGVFISLAVFLRKAAAKILTNPDALIPVGIYVTLDYFSGFLFQTSSAGFIGLVDARFNFANVTVSTVLFILVQVVIGVGFAGWMTRTLSQLATGDKVDLIRAFQDFRRWFPRALAVVLFGWLPMYLLLALIFLPALFIGNHFSMWSAFYPIILLICVLALIWNIMTAALLPHVLSSGSNLARAIAEGIKISWKSKLKTFLPVILLMILSGWIVFVSVSYTEHKAGKAEFGEVAESSVETVSSKFNSSVNFIWVGDYKESSKWHEQRMKAVEQESPPTVELRIMLLMLLLSSAVYLQIIQAIWRRNEEIEFSDSVNQNSSTGLSRFKLAYAVPLLLLLGFPFEYFRPSLENALYRQASDSDLSSQLKARKVYAGEGSLHKNELFTIGKQGTVDYRQAADAPDSFALGSLKNISIAENKNDLILSGGHNAIVLDRQGNIKEKIHFDLGKTQDSQSRDAYFGEVKPVDIDDDGVYEFAGFGSYPYTAFVLNRRGRMLWKHQGESIDIKNVEVIDADSDGKKEILVAAKGALKAFDLKGNEKWSQQLSLDFGAKSFFLDVETDGKIDVVTDGFGGGSTVIQVKSGETRKIEKPADIKGILEEDGTTPSILFFADNKFGLFDFGGNLLAKYDAPLSSIEDKRWYPDENDFDFQRKFASVFRAQAARVKFKTGEPKFLAVLATLYTKLPDESFIDMLYVYNADGRLVYQESFRNGGGQLITFPNENGTENLLVSEDKTVWSFAAN